MEFKVICWINDTQIGKAKSIRDAISLVDEINTGYIHYKFVRKGLKYVQFGHLNGHIEYNSLQQIIKYFIQPE